MFLANAYPSPDISTVAMTVIAVVMVGSLALWVITVYVAASERRERRRRHASGTPAGDKTVMADSSEGSGDYRTRASQAHA